MIDRIARDRGVPKGKVMKLAGLSPSSYYYKAKEGTRGIKPSKTTLPQTEGEVDNRVVVEAIRFLLKEEFKDYWGYH